MGTFFDARLDNKKQYRVAAKNGCGNTQFVNLRQVIDHYDGSLGLGLTEQERAT